MNGGMRGWRSVEWLRSELLLSCWAVYSTAQLSAACHCYWSSCSCLSV